MRSKQSPAAAALLARPQGSSVTRARLETGRPEALVDQRGDARSGSAQDWFQVLSGRTKGHPTVSEELGAGSVTCSQRAGGHRRAVCTSASTHTVPAGSSTS